MKLVPTNQVKKQILFTLTFGCLVVVWSIMKPNLALAADNICCVYYKGTQNQKCSLYDKDVNQVVDVDAAGDGTGVLTTTFACSLYNATTKTLGNNPFPIESTQFIIDSNLAGSVSTHEDDSKLFSQATASNYCFNLSAFTVELLKDSKLNLNTTQSQKCDYASAHSSFAFEDALAQYKQDLANKVSESKSAAEKTVSELEALAKKTSNESCCIPKTPSVANKCESGNFEPSVLSIFAANPFGLQEDIFVRAAKAQALLDAIKIDNSKVFGLVTCGTAANKVLYPVACNSPVPLKSAPSSNYQKQGLIPSAQSYCSEANGPMEVPQKVYTEATFDASILNKLGTVDVKVYLGRIIKAVMGILGSITLVMFVYSGILFMTDRGSGESVGKAKEIAVWTSLGLVVIFASYAILNFIFQIFGK